MKVTPTLITLTTLLLLSSTHSMDIQMLKKPLEFYEHLVEFVSQKKAKAKSQDFTSILKEADDKCGPTNGLPDSWRFLGNTVASLTFDNPSASFSNSCFQENKITLTLVDKQHIEIEFITGQPKDLLCEDTYVYTDILNFHLQTMFTHGTHKAKYRISEDEYKYIEAQGLHIMAMCDPTLYLLPDMILTAVTFLTDPIMMKYGSIIPQWLVDAMYQFHYAWLAKWEKLKLIPREEKAPITTEWYLKNAKSGDTFCIYRGTGLSNLIMWGSGSSCSHVAMLLWGEGAEKDQLFVLQSDEVGINRRTIQEWWTKYKGKSMVMYPLAPEYREKFDTKKAWEFFEKMKGQPYGYSNFFFGYMDTPNDNYPQPLDSNAWNLVWYLISEIPFVGREYADLMWTAALNKRLGTEGLSLKEVINETTRRGMTMGELVAIPEKEEWLYNGKHHYVCCSFAIALFYHAGMFGPDIEIVPQEFSPKDVGELAIWDKNYKLPKECAMNDPELPYCQTGGLYKMYADYYNRVEPYSHMNEHCPSQAPHYKRPKGC